MLIYKRRKELSKNVWEFIHMDYGCCLLFWLYEKISWIEPVIFIKSFERIDTGPENTALAISVDICEYQYSATFLHVLTCLAFLLTRALNKYSLLVHTTTRTQYYPISYHELNSTLYCECAVPISGHFSNRWQTC